MVKNFLIILVLLLTLINGLHSQVICNGQKVILIEEKKCQPDNFILEFEDNFDGTSLDTSKWRTQFGVVRDPEQKSAGQWFTSKNVEVSNGTLKLIAKRDTLINQCFDIWMNDAIGMKSFCKDFYFSSAEISCKENFGYGKFEISCKLPRGKGLGTAFWIWTYKQQSEIDVFEFTNENGLFGNYKASKLSKIHCMNSHNDYGSNGVMYDCPTHYTGPDFSEAFHTFTLIWSPQVMQWFVDGELKRSSALFYNLEGKMVDCDDLKKYGEYILNKAFPKNPMHIISGLTTQIGSNAPDESTVLPASFEIDYIRYYKLQ